MSKVEIIKEFNVIMGTFLKQTTPLVGTTYSYYFKKLIKVNSTQPIKEFCANVLPYRQQIMDKDENYFSNDSTCEELVKGEYYQLSNILKLKSIYFKADENTREEIWAYFQALVLLSEQYKELKEKLKK